MKLDRPRTAGLEGEISFRATEGCNSIAGRRWACVYTHPQAERWANQNLTARGYQTYLPLHAVRVRDRVTPTITHVSVRPLFSRYLFVRFDHLTESWSPIRDTPGVVGLLHTGTHVHYANPGAVERLQATEEQRQIPHEDAAAWAPGTPCFLVAGPFTGRPAVVVDTHPLRIALVMLGGLREMHVTPDAIVPRNEGVPRANG